MTCGLAEQYGINRPGGQLFVSPLTGTLTCRKR